MLLRDKFFMNTKILDLTELYKFGFYKKIVTQKNMPLQAFATSTLRNSIGRRALARKFAAHLRKFLYLPNCHHV